MGRAAMRAPPRRIELPPAAESKAFLPRIAYSVSRRDQYRPGRRRAAASVVDPTARGSKFVIAIETNSRTVSLFEGKRIVAIRFLDVRYSVRKARLPVI